MVLGGGGRSRWRRSGRAVRFAVLGASSPRCGLPSGEYGQPDAFPVLPDACRDYGAGRVSRLPSALLAAALVEAARCSTDRRLGRQQGTVLRAAPTIEQ